MEFNGIDRCRSKSLNVGRPKLAPLERPSLRARARGDENPALPVAVDSKYGGGVLDID
jgi:hypothetical protein